MTRAGRSTFRRIPGDYDQQQVLLRFYEPLQRLAQSHRAAGGYRRPHAGSDLSAYKLLVAPSLNVIDEALAAKLLAWVKAGGHAAAGAAIGDEG